ncbi:MAG: FHA domain-containing protein [Deltaproteobacteria bacterium]|nr:FHA domain-containing protein [Deltaproteobacteria bacterium]
MMKIFLMNGSEKGKIYALSEDRVLIGRSRENHVFLSDKSVSRKHLEIIKRGERHLYRVETHGPWKGVRDRRRGADKAGESGSVHRESSFQGLDKQREI